MGCHDGLDEDYETTKSRMRMKTGYEPRTLEQCAAHVIEEAGEFMQAWGKIARFGIQEKDPRTGRKNLNAIHDECDDLLIALKRFKEKLPSNV